jgi:hypothetical protein
MGFDVNLESERGEVIASVGDPKNLLHRLLERAVSDAPLLAEIDWNGDTIFNRLQIPRFLSDWQAVARQARTSEDEKLVNAVRELADRCQGNIHQYLKFVGD